MVCALVVSVLASKVVIEINEVIGQRTYPTNPTKSRMTLWAIYREKDGLLTLVMSQ